MHANQVLRAYAKNVNKIMILLFSVNATKNKNALYSTAHNVVLRFILVQVVKWVIPIIFKPKVVTHYHSAMLSTVHYVMWPVQVNVLSAKFLTKVVRMRVNVPKKMHHAMLIIVKLVTIVMKTFVPHAKVAFM